MTANGRIRDSHLRPTSTPGSPGPLGIHDSASPDAAEEPAFTPGPLGINDRTESSGLSQRQAILLARLNEGWHALEKSRKGMVEILEYDNASPEKDIGSEMAKAWQSHGKLTLAYSATLKEYLRDFYDPGANWGTHLRIGQLVHDDSLRQMLGWDAFGRRETEDLTAKLATLACVKAFEHYWETKDKESLFYALIFAGELQAHSGDPYRELPFVVRSKLQRLADDHKPPDVERAWQSWIRSLITGVEAGAPLWLREIAKAVKPMDPIREHYERSKQNEGR